MLYRAHRFEQLPTDSNILNNPFAETDRRPCDTPYSLHLIMGLWFDQKFGHNFRADALFCTGDIEQAHDFGLHIIEIEPVGDYQICFSHQVRDLYFTLKQQERTLLPYHKNLEAIFEILEGLDFRHIKNAGLEEAAASDCEVMLYANQYRFKSI